MSHPLTKIHLEEPSPQKGNENSKSESLSSFYSYTLSIVSFPNAKESKKDDRKRMQRERIILLYVVIVPDLNS